jgi:hypothetical protein
MTSRLTLYPRERYASLLQNEKTLLQEALETWQDPVQFTDERVALVKDIFKKAFCLYPEMQLVGSTLPDAIVLQDIGDNHTFFAITLSPNNEWDLIKLESESQISWTKHNPFNQVLKSLSNSLEGGMTVEEAC